MSDTFDDTDIGEIMQRSETETYLCYVIRDCFSFSYLVL